MCNCGLLLELASTLPWIAPGIHEACLGIPFEPYKSLCNPFEPCKSLSSLMGLGNLTGRHCLYSGEVLETKISRSGGKVVFGQRQYKPVLAAFMPAFNLGGVTDLSLT